MSIIEANNLCRSFRVAKRDDNFIKYIFKRKFTDINAVSNINFKIEKGEMVGFIGPNGAGKSTTIKMLTGILVPTSGEIRVNGMIPHKFRMVNAKKIGVVFGQRSQLWWDLPVKDTYLLLKKIYKIPNNIYNKNLKNYGKLLGLNSFINQPVRQLSLGQRMRADLGAALLHNPDILFLDEPTIGLDIVVKKQIRNMIKNLRNERQTTVILTTHDMKDIEAICDRIIVIDEGTIILDMPMNRIKHIVYGSHMIHVDFEEFPEEINIPHVTVFKQHKKSCTLIYDSEKTTPAKVISKLAENNKLLDFSTNELSIDEIIMKIYNENY